MQLQTISQVSREFNISTRTLRYYEQIGLIAPAKKEQEFCRMYDSDTLLRLRQILILRKIRIPLKQIAEIINRCDVQAAIEIFEENLQGVENEINALSEIRETIQAFLDCLAPGNTQAAFLKDEDLLEIADSLTLSNQVVLQKPHSKMVCSIDLPRVRLSDRDVRIIYLPPSAVASYQYIGDEPEMHANQMIDTFVRNSDLVNRKPDLRHYGFNAPNPDETGYHGYETWVTIPDDMEVCEPLVKKYFEGGLYAAHTIPFGAFEEWEMLDEWVNHSEKYKSNTGEKGPECMFGLLEEHLNYKNHVFLENTEPEDLQLDLLYPIQLK